ncbi:MAG TPA: hypothetical protein VFD52_04050 [Clostridia bacterium]|nr:hypothetical protein [Clostridia bacterium]
MKSNVFNNGVPLGFGMALSQNTEALRHFSALPQEKQKELIEITKSISSKSEMRSFVNSLTGYN